MSSTQGPAREHTGAPHEAASAGTQVPEGGSTPPPALPDWLSLAGAVAVVTGGGTHLGLAMATALAELGATIYLLGRRADVVQASAATLQAQGRDAYAVSADAADEVAVEKVVQDIVQRHGRLDIMVCNAGGGVGTAMAPHIPVADLEATLRQNVTTTLACAQSAARAMMARQQGAIITIGSLHATLGSDPRLYAPGYRRSTQSYHAAKGAILNLTRALACELAQYGITVNCLSPGQIPKPGLNAFTRENFRNMVPLGRLGEPADLKGAVALFASPAGRWITGQNLTVDGGWCGG
jgi:NAD(P)-dependent dehydrogenase (short-subunit alcohol dehydrogenase family)